MGKEFSIVPQPVSRVDTKYRRVSGSLPHPDSVATLKTLSQYEPQSMRGQPPIVWERAEDIVVFDKYGNTGCCFYMANDAATRFKNE